MRAALYARVSSEEQVEGYSIDAQRRAFQTLCDSKGWTPYEFIEEGRSARTEDINKRPIFKQAMAAGLAHEYDVLVVHKVDRFSRKLRITLEYFDKLGKAGVGFFSIVEQMDFSTPWGKFTLSMLGGLAELYSDNLSLETKKGWHERRAQGLYCGTLPFGTIKGEDGVPIPDTQERRVSVDDHERSVVNYDGLKTAFDLAEEGKSDREIAIAMSAAGYRTTGTHGARPFSKDTVKDMLNNRFYIGYIPDGNGGWLRAKHSPFVSEEAFKCVQDLRQQRRHSKNGSIKASARTYSLSGLLWCATCNSKVGIHQGHGGKSRIYCRGRAQGKSCSCRTTFLEVYERQIEWYLQNFVVPDDYKERILEAHRKLQNAYDDVEKQRRQLQNRLQRIKELYKWEHIDRKEYLREHDSIGRELLSLAPKEDDAKALDRIAHFLNSVADVWKEASQERRNQLACVLFEEIRVENSRVVGVKPRKETRPFFQLSYDEHLASSTRLPEAPRGRQQYQSSDARISAWIRGSVGLPPWPHPSPKVALSTSLSSVSPSFRVALTRATSCSRACRSGVVSCFRGTIHRGLSNSKVYHGVR
jgi:site-specific DNA recombinase